MNNTEKRLAELAIFWQEIADNLPKSLERSALGDEKMFLAFASVYPKMAEHLEQEMLKRVENMRDLPPPFPADKENPMKHVYQNQGYTKALDDVLKPLPGK